MSNNSYVTVYKSVKEIFSEIVKNKYTSKNKYSGLREHYTPEYTYDYEKHTLTMPSRPMRKASFRKGLSEILAFIHYNKYLRKRDACTIIPIPTTNKRLMSLCGNQREVSRMIQLMKDMNLIEVHTSNYTFGHHRNFCKKYRYFYEVELEFIQFCKDNNIEPKEYSMPDVKSMEDILTNKADVRIATKLKLLRPSGMTQKDFNAILCNVIRENYPVMSEYEEMVKYINETYYKDAEQFQISFKPNIEYNGGKHAGRYATKIGLRATNSLVNVPAHIPTKMIITDSGEFQEVVDDDKVKNYQNNSKSNFLLRKDILEHHGLDLSYDVSGSVPRLTYSINNGYWENDIDFYKKIYDSMMLIQYRENHPDCSDEITIENISQYSNDYDYDDKTRSSIKSLFMFAYFDDKRKRVMGSHVCHQMIGMRKDESVYNTMESLRLAVEGVLGDLKGSEIFFHESCIYMNVTKELLDRGFKVWQVYDAWYAHKDGVTQVEYSELVETLIEESFNIYMAKIN